MNTAQFHPNSEKPFVNAKLTQSSGVLQGEAAQLGTIANSVSQTLPETYPLPENSTERKFFLQEAATKLLPQFKIAKCLRAFAPVTVSESGALSYTSPDTVEIMRRGGDHPTASYKNLQTCDSVWCCPVCSAKISEQRRQKLAVACKRAKEAGLFIGMGTFTFRHNKRDKLKNIFELQAKAYRKLKQGRAWIAMRDKYGWLGDIRATEVTYGNSGWHPHLHVLIVLKERPTPKQWEELQFDLRKRWIECLQKVGLNAKWGVGAKLTSDQHKIEDYIAKFGREPSEEKFWSVAHEMSKANVKLPRDIENATPFQLLASYATKQDLGCSTAKQSAALYIEYAKATKGKRQMEASRDFWDLFDMKDISQEEILAELQIEEIESEVVLKLSKYDWKAVRYSRGRGVLLAFCAAGEMQKARAHVEFWKGLYPY